MGDLNKDMFKTTDAAAVIGGAFFFGGLVTGIDAYAHVIGNPALATMIGVLTGGGFMMLLRTIKHR